MTRDGIGAYLIPIGRTVSAFISGILLALLGDVAGRVFNLLIGYPWSLSTHQAINLLGIGFGAGLGAHLAWINLNERHYAMLASLLAALAGGALGAFLGRIYGPGVNTDYYWSRFAIDTTIHLTAAVCAVAVATTLGLIKLWRSYSVRAAMPDRNAHRPLRSGPKQDS